MKKLFQAVNKRDFATVKSIIDKSPDLVNCISIGAVKADEGQSLLRVAVKNSSYDIVEFLVQNGADINFYTLADDMYISHQAIYTVLRRTIPSTAYEGTFDDAFKILNLLINEGIDLTSKDKFNRNCFQSGIGISRGCVYNNIHDYSLPDDNEWLEKIKSVFQLLLQQNIDTSLPEMWKNVEGIAKWRMNILDLCAR